MGKHVFWDCDGTLVDSELLAMPAAVDTLIAYFDDPETFDPFVREVRIRSGAGMHFGQMFDQWWDEYRPGTPLDPEARVEQTAAEKRNVLRALEAVEPIRGVLDALHLAERYGFTNHVVTSSALDRVLQCLDTTDLRQYFQHPVGSTVNERIYSATTTLDPPQPKPDPAIYFHALNAAGIGPEDAVAIEDSVSGVRSAVAAGIRVVGFIVGSHITPEMRSAHTSTLLEAGADRVVTQPSRLRHAVLETLEPARSLS